MPLKAGSIRVVVRITPAEASAVGFLGALPGYELEVVVEALAGGSFKAQVRALYRGAENLFSSQTAKTIAMSVVAAFIYQHTLAPDIDVVINVRTDEVVIEQGDTRVIVPREIYDATQEAGRSPKFRKGVSQTMQTVEADPEVHSFGFSQRLGGVPELEIRRDQFAILPRALTDEDEDGDSRELLEVTELEILRAILERSKTRRWEFAWGGVKISGPVTDDTFWNNFAAHSIRIGCPPSCKASDQTEAPPRCRYLHQRLVRNLRSARSTSNGPCRG